MNNSTAAAMWSRADLRARWKSLVVLGLLAGLTAGLAIASYDGSLRTATALGRLNSHTKASDAVIFPSQTAFLETPDWTALSTRPEVERIGRWGLVFGTVDGEDNTLFAPMDDVFLNEVDRPIVVAGRMFDPGATNEMIVTDEPPDDGSPVPHLGDVIHLAAYVKGTLIGTPQPGPAVDITVVGIVHTPLSYVFTGGAFLTPGFVKAYSDKTDIAENAVVRLRNGAADMPALRRDASTDVIAGVPVLDLHTTARRITATTDVERVMLLLLALIIALAGVAFVGQAVVRSAGPIGVDVPALNALGMTRRDLTRAGVAPHLLAGAVAVVATVATAVVASRWFPVGLAAQVDPDRGIRVDVALLVAMTALVAVLFAVGVVVATWLAAGPVEDRSARARPAWLARLGLRRPLAMSIGTRMALEGRHHNRQSTALPALVGAVASVAGVVGVLTIDHGLIDAVHHPEVAGVTWDASVNPNPDGFTADGVDPAVIQRVRSQPGVAEATVIGRVVAQIGDVGVPAFTVIDRPGGPGIDLVTLAGRAPEHADEVTLGPSTAKDLGVGIGDDIVLADGKHATVVGLGLFPSDVHAQFDEGAWLSPDRWSDVVRAIGGTDAGPASMIVAVRFADRTHLPDQVAALGTALGPTVQYVASADLPLELTNLHNIRRVPNVLAAFLAVLGVIAAGHALFSSVRRRRKDFAVLRSLGMTPGASRAILATHGSIVAVVGLAIGVPLGLIVGRAGWRAIADRVPLTFRSPITLAAIVLVLPAAVLIANLLAVLPGQRAVRIDPATVLRSE